MAPTLQTQDSPHRTTESSRHDELIDEITRLRRELRRTKRKLLAERSKCGALQRKVASASAKVQAVEEADRVATKNGVEIRRRAGKGAEAASETRDNVYVFEDDDASRSAFDDFFSAPDPHLEKVRQFLLD